MEQFNKSSTTNKTESNEVNDELIQQNFLNSIVSEPKFTVRIENIFFEFDRNNKIIEDLSVEIPEGKFFHIIRTVIFA